MAKRFGADSASFAYYYQGQQVASLPALASELQRNGKNSVKMEARLEGEQPSRMESEQPSRVESLKDESVLLLPPETELKAMKQVNYVLPKAYHQCYCCDGNGMMEQEGLKTMCYVCGGVGEFDKDHKYIKHISKLLEMSLKKEEAKGEKMVEEKV